MTEAEWLASTDVRAMYVFLNDTTVLNRTRRQGYLSVLRFSLSERKSRLFAVACCRRILHLMPTREARECVLAAEQYADGQIDDEGLRTAVAASVGSCEKRWRRGLYSIVAAHPAVERATINALGRVHREKGARAAVSSAVAEALAYATMCAAQEEYSEENYLFLQDAEFARQADFLRDIVGNPYQPSTFDPIWLAWQDHCVERIARGIYEERTFERLPILHDALLDAGCDDERILAHCRTAEGHVRGCWVLDLLLGKE
jgi:hypothetical protein